MFSTALSDCTKAPQNKVDLAMPDASKNADDISWLSQAEWVLARPDSFIGSIARTDCTMRILRDGRLVDEVVSVSPGLLRLAGELVSNAVDNARRGGSAMKKIEIAADATSGRITVTNDGPTLPVRIFEGTDRYQPSIAFSEFQAGQNFRDEEVRHTLGRNGVGAKGANCFGTRFEVNIVSPPDRKSFSQVWESNMTVVHPPKVASNARKTSMTQVVWDPDYAKLDMQDVAEKGLSNDVVCAIGALAAHASLCVPRGVTVLFNGARVGLSDPKAYATALGATSPFASDVVKDSSGQEVLQICAAARSEAAQGCVAAFVNGGLCNEGTHVNWILDKIRSLLLEKVQRRVKDGAANIKPAVLRQEIVLVATFLLPNPTFTSQQKDCLDLKVSKFGFTFDPDAGFRAALERTPLVDRIATHVRLDIDKALRKHTKAPRGRPVMSKYEPALKAGKAGHAASLILTEGDSAKALAVAGISVVGRDLYGVYPLRGKLINPRNAAAKKVCENAEVSAVMRIIGLEWGKEYDEDSVARLRYQRILAMTDQDVDGSHITSLVCNCIASCFPSILRVRPDFIWRFVTPIVRVTLPGGARESFFSEVEFRRWRDDRVASGLATGTSKYYKGLGSSTPSDAREYFASIAQNQIRMVHSGPSCEAALELHFNDKMAASRRAHMQEQYNPVSFVDYAQDSVTYERFLDDELMHFHLYACRRQVPSLFDGLVPARRKVLYTMLHKKIVKDVKVAQLCASVAEFTHYHHAETALCQSVVNMARDHVFANNVALLYPSGMFGSRHAKGDDAAPRYIHTRLDPVVDALFPSADMPVLEYEEDDGERTEPKAFVPVIPMVLVNGCSGIGTGWSTFVPPHCPHAVVNRCRYEVEALIDPLGEDERKPPPPIQPWYAGFKGTVEQTEDDHYIVTGQYEVRGDEVHILELPPGRVTDDYADYVRATLYVTGGSAAVDKRFVVSDYSLNTDSDVHLVLVSTIDLIEKVRAILPQILRMQEKVSTSNMCLFDGAFPAKMTYEDIFRRHAEARISTYERRLKHEILKKENDLLVASNKARYIREVREEIIKPQTARDDDDAARVLTDRGFDGAPDFKYLLDMRIGSLSHQRAAHFDQDVERLQEELTKLRSETPARMWMAELDHLDSELRRYRERKQASSTDALCQKRASNGNAHAKRRKTAK